ncbi:hypothetical protein QF002_001185 [Paraburkholderia youngii]
MPSERLGAILAGWRFPGQAREVDDGGLPGPAPRHAALVRFRAVKRARRWCFRFRRGPLWKQLERDAVSFRA